MSGGARASDNDWCGVAPVIARAARDSMTGAVPLYKGMGFWPVINALKAHARGRRSVPDALQHYLEDDVVVTGWYPESDFIALLESLAEALQGDGIQDVWQYFGSVAAQRDLAGEQNLIPEERRVPVAGIYRRLAADEVFTITTWLDRVTKLWRLYHDTGRMVAGRPAGASDLAVFRLYERPTMPAHYLQMHSAYFAEYARIAQLRATVHFCGYQPGPGGYAEWELLCAPDPELKAALATLPRLPGR